MHLRTISVLGWRLRIPCYISGFSVESGCIFKSGFMNETDYIHLVSDYLDELMEKVETQYWEVVECDLNTGVLSMKTRDNKEFIINRNIPKQELWLSSPFSGGAHFEYQNNVWKNTRTGDLFEPLIFSELDQLKQNV